MRIYRNVKQVRQLKQKSGEYPRIFIRINQNIPELRLYKGAIIEADDYNKATKTYSVFTGYGEVRVWKSMCKEVM